MNVYCLIRDMPWYRHKAFENGVQAAGHKLCKGLPPAYDKDTVLLIWNRYAELHTVACKVEAAGGTVLVAENGYLGRGGTSPKFDVHPAGPKEDDYYALARGYHNGGGTWHVGDASRLNALDVPILPWRTGPTLLVAPNRSFGVPGRMQPFNWAEDIKRPANRICDATGLRPRMRAHPGNDAPKKPISEDLADAAMVLIWSSSVGVHALVSGVRVLCCAPYWICKSAAYVMEDLNSPHAAMPRKEAERMQALVDMSWAQWTVKEIESGLPFAYLLGGVS